MIEKTALKIFGGLIEPYLDYFDSLRLNLKKARMMQEIDEYVSLLLLSSTIAFVVIMVFVSFFLTIAIPIPEYTVTLSIILSFVGAGLVFAFGFYYPSIKTGGLRHNIEKSLPFAAFYMTTSSSSGINPVEIFNVVSMRGGVIGDEAKRIYTNVKTLGMDLTTALHKAAMRSPSPLFSDLLWGMMSVITTGGDLEAYLKSKTESLMGQYRRSLNDYAKSITLYTEIYITLIIVGSLFFIILIAIMAPMVGTGILFIQAFIVFFFIPMVSMGYIVLLKSISPTE